MSWNDLIAVYNAAPNPTEGAAQVQALVKQAQEEQKAQATLIQNIQKSVQDKIKAEQDRVDAIFQYQQWVGYLFANPTKNGPALNDFKRRVFQPTCTFKRDWSIYNPTTANSFIGVATADEANVAYNKFLLHLSKSNEATIPLLNDAKSRFFTDDCAFLNPDNLSDYSTNLSPVFK